MDSSEQNILIVDDKIEIRDSLSDLLKAKGFNSDSAANAEDALIKLRDKHFDLVIADIVLPGMNGLELCKQIRSEYNIEVIIMTGYDEYYSAEMALESGAVDFIYKPCRLDDLVYRVRRILRLKKAFHNEYGKIEYEHEFMFHNAIRKNVIRQIEFPPEYFKAGMLILSSFGDILRKKFPASKQKIKIEQKGLKVKMIIEPISGSCEIIEHELNNFGLVIKGEMTVEQYTDDKLLALDLKNQIVLAKSEIEMQKNLLVYRDNEVQKRDMQIEKLLNILSSSISAPTNINMNIPVNAKFVNEQKLNINGLSNVRLIQVALGELKEQVTENLVISEKIDDLFWSLSGINNHISSNELKESSAIQKLHNFINDLGDERSSIGKIIKGLKNGISIVQDLASYYNDLAQWCGLPQMPKPFLKNKKD